MRISLNKASSIWHGYTTAVARLSGGCLLPLKLLQQQDAFCATRQVWTSLLRSLTKKIVRCLMQLTAGRILHDMANMDQSADSAYMPLCTAPLKQMAQCRRQQSRLQHT